MYFSRIRLKEDVQRSSRFWQVFRNPYTLHQSVWQLFGDHADRRRDFLYRLEQEGKQPLIYTVSVRKPEISSDLWYVETKPYEPKIKEGMQLAFMLRANPIRTKRDERNRQHRHDVVMEVKTRLKKEGLQQNKSLAAIVQEEGSNWLLSRAEKHGFVIDSDHIRVDGYRQHCFFKGKGNKRITFSTLDFSGLLTVVDPECFIKTLYAGIGHAKGFGCGLMLVRRY